MNRIVTKSMLASNPGAVARTGEYWQFPPRPGVLLLDFDPPTGDAKTPEELWSLLLTIAPSLSEAGVLWWSSGSSHIWAGSQELQGQRGIHMFVLLQDLSDTERIGDVLMRRLALAGHMRVEISKSGAKLLRYTFDEALFETCRLSFEGGAVCEAPLDQRRGSPSILSAGGWWDSREGLPDLSPSDEAKYAALVADARARAEPDAAAMRGRWTFERHGDAMAALIRSGVPVHEASERASRTLETALQGVLMGDFEVETADGTRVTVGELLDNRERWHRVELKDPLDPGRRGGAPCAMFFAWGAVPTIHSFGRGGSLFKLMRQPERLYVTKGQTPQLATELLGVIAKQPDLFMRGGSVAMVNDGDVRPLDRHGLAHTLGTRCAFVTRGKDRDSATDLPTNVVDQLLSIVPTMRTRELKSLALLPFARPDGTIVTAPGFDTKTGVFSHFDAEKLAAIPAKPTAEDVIAAVRQIWRPVEAYPLATDADRAGMFAAIMTAVVRPAIEIAPGFLYEAPIQSAGKTRAALVCGALIRNRRGGSTPFVGGPGADAELSKKLVALVRAGEGFFLLDNVVGHYRSSVLSALITDGTLDDRVLGTSTWFKGSARLFVALTANNASIDADIQTRLVRVRIDPRCERPQAREFDFEPVSRAMTERLAIARAVLVLIRAHQDAGAPATLPGGTRFEEWAALTRQPIGWAQRMGYADAAGVGALGDPAASLLASAAVGDPDTEAWAEMLRGIDLCMTSESFLTRELLPLVDHGQRSGDEGPTLIRGAVEELLGLAGLSAKRLGHALKNRRDRIAGGRVLRACPVKDRDGMQRWIVVRV